MNPLTNVKNLQKINERELKLGIAGKDSKSWHQKYKDSAWVFIGGLPYELSEGDVISVFSQYGEIVNLNLVRDGKSGKSRGFCFLCYEDQRSTVLAVDNLNGIKILGRIIRVDHVEEYRVPKERGDEEDVIKKLHMEGCAPAFRKPVAGIETASSNLSVKHPKVEKRDIDFDKVIVEDKRILEIRERKKNEDPTTSNEAADARTTSNYFGGFRHEKNDDWKNRDFNERREYRREESGNRREDGGKGSNKGETSTNKEKRSSDQQTKSDLGDKKRKYDDDAYVPKRYNRH